MPGVIENDDPGDGGIHRAEVVVSFAREDVAPLDVEVFVDRLRFMGLGPEIVDEAERRLRADQADGMRWLEVLLKELEPPRPPLACTCGEALIDGAWRGWATIRCRVCGTTWGVEVVDEETDSQWPISGADPEWRQAHPVVEYHPYGDYEPDDVLRVGLPPLPRDGIEPGTYFPVATWKGDRDAAVLYVHRRLPEETHGLGDEYEDETEHLVPDEDGGWTSTGSGGGTWLNVFDPPADLLDKYVVFWTGISGSGDGDEAVSFTGGLCSASVAAVETIEDGGTTAYPIDRERPFFVVGIRGRGRVRVLDQHGNVVRGPRGEPLEQWVDR